MGGTVVQSPWASPEGAKRGTAPSLRQPNRAPHRPEASGPGEAGQTRAQRLSHQREPAPRGELPSNPPERGLGRGEECRRIGA